MIIIRDSSQVQPQHQGGVVAIGNFDGLHLGHQAVIRKTVELARAQAKPAIVLSFEPHPRRVFKPDLPTLRIMPFHEKATLLQAMGIDALRVIRFTPRFAKTTAAQFIETLLRRELKVMHVVTGEDFTFGYNREGTSSFLQNAGGFSYTACAPVVAQGERCSSTRIREHLSQGEVEKAAQLLGRPYRISGRVREGDKRGRTLGFPTANILPERLFLPAKGIYAVRAGVRGKQIEGVASLGHNPMFNHPQLRLETHLFGWNESIYGERIEVELLHRLRAEENFPTLDALKVQIAKDCAQARQRLADS